MSTIEDTIKNLPDRPGIYLYYNQAGELIYVGKATSLTSRVRSYFRGARTPRPIEEVIHEVVSINWRETDSVLEAIILESVYIKKHLPKYNVLGKDNKSWNYIVITKDEYPKVLTIRQHELETLKANDLKAFKQFQYIGGPYPGLNTAATMKILRRLFLFSTCLPARSRDEVGTKAGKPALRQRRAGKRPCLYYEMGQCRGVCISAISPADYRREVIAPLRWFLSGKKKTVIQSFERQMKAAAKAEQFEDAARLRNQLHSLQRIHDVTLINKSFFDFNLLEEASGQKFRRIEGYDISNLGTTDKVGSMVVFSGHEPLKSAYRKFNIKAVVGQSDVDCMAEVLSRRLGHHEWPTPDLIVLDGGRPQINRIKLVFKAQGVTIPFVGIAKGPERKRNDIILGAGGRDVVQWVSNHRDTLVRVRDEAHRFAIAFNRSKRKIKL